MSIPIELDNQTMLWTMEMCSSVFNIHSEWGFRNRTYNKNKAHHALYDDIRKRFPKLPSAMVQACRDNAMESLRACKLASQPMKRPLSGIRLDRRTFSIRGSLLTVASVSGRQKTRISFPEFSKGITNIWKLKGAILIYSRRQKRFRINLCYEMASPPPIQTGKVVGIDRGLHHIAVTSAGDFFSSGKIRASQRRFLHVRKMLQAKGTKSAKRRLRRMAGRERRFSRDVNHVVSRRLAEKEGVSIFVLETLDGIRQKKRGKHLNKRISSWPFRQFEMFLQYKAEVLGKSVAHVDARYTSQRCSRCGCVNADNRDKSRFLCVRCGMRMHADLNAAVNIRDRWILSGLPKGNSEAGLGQQATCGSSPSGLVDRKPTGLPVGS